MKRRFLIKLLDLLVYWVQNCSSCVKWDGILSNVVKLAFGVRLCIITFLFAIYLDDLVDYRRSYYYNFVILYADDINMLLACSVCELQRMLTACERELS